MLSGGAISWHDAKGGFETVVDLEFIEDISKMGLDGLAADKDLLPDLFVRQTFEELIPRLFRYPYTRPQRSCKLSESFCSRTRRRQDRQSSRRS